jgi:hypothetical protein
MSCFMQNRQGVNGTLNALYRRVIDSGSEKGEQNCGCTRGDEEVSLDQNRGNDS